MTHREGVYRAAVELFMTKGFENTTMDEIATAAGTARRTVFNHFPAKTDIAVEWAIRRGKQAAELAQRIDDVETPGSGRIQSYFHEIGLRTERDWNEFRHMVSGWLRDGSAGHRPYVSGQVLEWLREWLPDTAADLDLATNVLFDVFQGVLLRRMNQDPPVSDGFTAEVDAAIGIVLNGLSSASRG